MTFQYPSTETGFTTDTAITVALSAHEGQFDWYGVPYINHPLTVAANVASHPHFRQLTVTQQHLALQVAYLHDTIEDTSLTFTDLTEAGAPLPLISVLHAVTHQPGELLPDYYTRITDSGVIATLVKLADIAHNENPRRLAPLPPDVRTQLESKYQYAKLRLLEVYPELEWNFPHML